MSEVLQTPWKMEQQTSDFRSTKRGLCSKGKLQFGSTLSPIFPTHFYRRRQNVQLTGFHCKSQVNIAGTPCNLKTVVTNTARSNDVNKHLHMRYPFSFSPPLFKKKIKLVQKRAEATSVANLQEQECRGLASPAATGLWQSWALQLTILLTLKKSWKINKK